MRLTRKTILLLVTAAVLALLNLVGVGETVTESLPTLAATPPESVVRISLSTPIQKLTLERGSTEKGSPDYERWRIITPLQFPADAAQIRSLLRAFGPGVPMEALVDEGNLEDYGVDHQAGTLVELFTHGAEVPAVSLVVGKQAAGPSTFVRLSGGDAVYRADVGGQSRYSRPAADWRDKAALEFTAADARTVELTSAGGTLRFVRNPSIATDADGKPLPGEWSLPGAPFTADTASIEALVRMLSNVRAAEIHNPDYEAGFDAPVASATVGMDDGSTHRIVLGGRSDAQAAFVRVDDRPDIFRTSPQLLRALTLPMDAYRDRRILSLAAKEIETVTLSEGGLTVVLEQSPEGWAITQPPNMDADQRQSELMATTLASLRADAIPADTRFEPTGAKLTIRLREGRVLALEIGQVERDAAERGLVRVRVVGQPSVYQIRAATLVELRRVFGRA